MSSTRGSSRIILIAATILFIAAGQAGASCYLQHLWPRDWLRSKLGRHIGRLRRRQPGLSQPVLLRGSAIVPARQRRAGGRVGHRRQPTECVGHDRCGGSAGSGPGVLLVHRPNGLLRQRQSSSGRHLRRAPAADAGNQLLARCLCPRPHLGGLDVRPRRCSLGRAASSIDGGPWNVEDDSLDAFRINGTVAAVPVPGACCWVLSGWAVSAVCGAAGPRSGVPTSIVILQACASSRRPVHFPGLRPFHAGSYTAHRFRSIVSAGRQDAGGCRGNTDADERRFSFMSFPRRRESRLLQP